MCKKNNIKFNQRDVSILKLDERKDLVIGCDSAGGIGPKPGDQLQVPAKTVGKFITRVPLMEVKAVGAEILNVIDTLSVEWKPTGQEIIKGIVQEIKILGLDPSEIINGSTEENMKTIQTGIGVTVIGIVDSLELKLATSNKNDVVVALGYPFVGNEVVQNENMVADLKDLIALQKMDFIHEILPVGSKGIRYEAKLLAKMSKLKINFINQIDLDLDKSAGPGSVLLATLPSKYLNKLKRNMSKPLNQIGELNRMV